MQTHHLKATISNDRRLVINGLPFNPGDMVEVIIQSYQDEMRQNDSLYPLKGKPFRYTEPFGSIAEDEWETLK